MGVERELVYCAFCKNDRKIYRQKSLGLWGWFTLAFLGISLAGLIFEELNWSLALGIGAVIAVVEVAVHFRWRLALICRECGFDPLVYRRSPHRAATLVKQHLEFRKNSSRFLLSRPLQVSRREKNPESSI